MSEIKFVLNDNSAAWREVFLNNSDIRAALESHGNALAASEQARAGVPQECDIRVLRNTQVARIRATSERLSDEEAAERKAKAARKGRKKYWRNQRKNQQ